MATSEANAPYEIEIKVETADIDQLGHVNNVVYLRWVQDAAVAHWYAAATEAEQQALLWVVVKHEIEYKRPAFIHDTIVARTWVGGSSRRAFERHTELVRQVDGKLLAKALTIWCPVDAKTMKPVEVAADTQRRFSTGTDSD